MKLLSTLRYGSTTGMAAGAGNYGGDLRLFFTTVNPADTKPGPGTPPSVLWQGTGHGAVDTYKLPNGDVLALNLNLVGGIPNQLYIYGTIEVTTGGNSFAPPLGQAGSFAPGQSVLQIQKARYLGLLGGKPLDVGFEIAMPWDGTMADCHGQWWAVFG